MSTEQRPLWLLANKLYGIFFTTMKVTVAVLIVIPRAAPMVDVANCADVQMGLLALKLVIGCNDDETATTRADLEGGWWLGHEGGRHGVRERGGGDNRGREAL
jgi:hypothetical protein